MGHGDDERRGTARIGIYVIPRLLCCDATKSPEFRTRVPSGRAFVVGPPHATVSPQLNPPAQT